MKILLKGIKRPRSGYEPKWMQDADLTYDHEFEVEGFNVVPEDMAYLQQAQAKPGDVVEHNPRGGCTDWPPTGRKRGSPNPHPFNTAEVRKWEGKPYVDMSVEPYFPADDLVSVKLNTVIYFLNMLMGLYGRYVAGGAK